MTELSGVVAENVMDVAPGLGIKVMVLDNVQRIVPVEDMQRACEWLGVDMKALTTAGKQFF
ncbi:hypothetical protein [Mixta intestinalis]|uniref:Uncharacterized protein n=1 Tax=Mixta intestinalis TaxID=1615494 RepID=A0A6P1PYS4_9GAMM|nr:hypothetical protein [Mixta intestinalis]QHM71311.1 hypothetical protein C7M51_01597 [Mixta intestinalis]